MPDFLIDDFPPALMARFELQAKQNGRDVNSEILAALDEGMKRQRVDEVLRRLKRRCNAASASTTKPRTTKG